MNIRSIDDNNDDGWFNSFFDFRSGVRRRIREGRIGLFDIDPVREFENMEKEMARMFDQIKDIQTNAPKNLLREYQIPDGAKVREVGPLVYGYSMTVGPDGKPKVMEFGNIKPTGRIINSGMGITAADAAGIGSKHQLSTEREPLAEVNVTNKEVKVVLEMPGFKKDDIKINAYDGSLEVMSINPQRKYRKTMELPQEADIETAKSTYNNGILEVTFSKKENAVSKGKEKKNNIRILNRPLFSSLKRIFRRRLKI